MTEPTKTYKDEFGREIDMSADVFPAFRALSAAHFFNATLVWRGQAPLEMVDVPMLAQRSEDDGSKFIMAHSFCWEGGPWRPEHLLEDLPPRLSWIRRLPFGSDTVLVPNFPDDIYPKYSPLYHLLPQRLISKYRLPVSERGIWPRTGLAFRPLIGPELVGRLSQAFATLVWPLLNGRGRIGAFSNSDPVRLIAHDLDYWLGPMEQVIREMMAAAPRVRGEKEKAVRETIDNSPPLPPDLDIATPKVGRELWEGEGESLEVSRRLVEKADQSGGLRAILEAIRCDRVEDDFSNKWSFERADFERKLYRKRSKVKISFVELDDTLPHIGPGSDIEGEMMWRDLFALVDRQDRRVVVCLRNGHTKLIDIAEELGYANHSPVSKALSRIRKAAAKLLE